MNRGLAEGCWVVGGHALTALGTLVGVRLLTQFLTPAAYGEFSLTLGISALALSLVAAPPTQAAIHFYPKIAAEQSGRALLESLRRCFRTIVPWVLLVALIGGFGYVHWGAGSPLLVVLLVALLASDSWRSAYLSMLNAARLQTRYAVWVTADAWLRPLAGVAAVLAFGQATIVVLSAYLVVSVCVLAVLSRNVWPPEHVHNTPETAERERVLDKMMWAYALPLTPLGIITWASNVGDRYIIGGVLTLADAGVYAAVYGLSSSMFIIIGQMAEQTLRPHYQSAVSRGDRAGAQRILGYWLATVGSICALGVLVFAFGHRLLAHFAVGEAFRSASNLMPWIAAGYAIRTLANVFERVCYAHGKTPRVLVIQLFALGATVIATPVGVVTLGLEGAAMAVPVYFFVGLLAALYFAQRTLREASGERAERSGNASPGVARVGTEVKVS